MNDNPKSKGFKKIRKEQQIKKLTNQTIEIICNNLRLGHYIETAVVMAGVSKTQFYEWIKLSHERKKSKNKFIQLRSAVEKAMAEAETRDLLVIDKCANGREAKFLRDDDGNLVLSDRGNPILSERELYPDWNAAAWRLERKYPKRWGKTDKIEHSGPDGGPITTSKETEEQKKERKHRILQKIKKLQILSDD